MRMLRWDGNECVRADVAHGVDSPCNHARAAEHDPRRRNDPSSGRHCAAGVRELAPLSLSPRPSGLCVCARDPPCAAHVQDDGSASRSRTADKEKKKKPTVCSQGFPATGKVLPFQRSHTHFFIHPFSFLFSVCVCVHQKKTSKERHRLLMMCGCGGCY